MRGETEWYRGCAALLSMVVGLQTAHAQPCPSCEPPTYNLSCGAWIADESYHNLWHIEAVRACEVWRDLGYNGAGVVVGVVNLGILATHEDLDAQIEWGCSEPVPEPISSFWEDIHGTQMASIVGAEANNPIGQMRCNLVGVAHGARLAEVFWGDGFVPPPPGPEEHAQVIGFANECIDIKVHAYDLMGESGTYQPIPQLIRNAFTDAAQNGRGKLGQVFVWSAGNGAGESERTDYEELVSARQVVSVGAISPNHKLWPGSEPGSSLFCCAPGDEILLASRFPGGPPYQQNNACTTGTSYSAPVVAGVVALMQQANPDLGWRDVMDAIVRTATTIDAYHPASNPGGRVYQTNQAGVGHAYEYGHGLIDAFAAVCHVDPAINPAWEPLLYEREIPVALNPNGMTVGPGQTKVLAIDVLANMRVEHVELEIDVSTSGGPAPNIGPLEITVERIWESEMTFFGGSGSGGKTRSVFTVARTDPRPGYDGAIFTSVRHWGETGTARWRVVLRNTSGSMTATWHSAQLRLHGAPNCVADWNMDGFADEADDVEYRQMHGAGDAAADLNHDQAVNGADLILWQNLHYPGGCE